MTGELDSPRSATSLRDAFTASVRGRRERRPSQTAVRGALRPFPFAFEIPRPEHAGLSGQELPPTFSSVTAGECGPRGRTGVERSEVSYSVTALWEAVDGSDRLLYVLHAPLVICYPPWLTFSLAAQGRRAYHLPTRPRLPVARRDAFGVVAGDPTQVGQAVAVHLRGK